MPGQPGLAGLGTRSDRKSVPLIMENGRLNREIRTPQPSLIFMVGVSLLPPSCMNFRSVYGSGISCACGTPHDGMIRRVAAVAILPQAELL